MRLGLLPILALLSFLAGCSASHNANDTSADEATYLAVQSRVIGPYCVSCHTGSAALGGGLSFASYEDLMNSGTVVAGSPAKSTFYTTLAGGTMPPGGGVAAPERPDGPGSLVECAASREGAHAPTAPARPCPAPSAGCRLPGP